MCGQTRTPLTDLDSLPLPAYRAEGPLHLGGVPIAFVIAARGCFGECAYCSIAAYSKDAGGDRFRMRSPENVAAEIGEIHDNHGVRTFFFQDDIFILPSKRRTLARIDQLSTALRSRGVNEAIYWVKGRPESITPQVAKAAADMGVVHMFLGVESACDERLRYLGRTHRGGQNLEAIANLEAAGIRASFNLMLFDPENTLEQIVTTIDFAEQTAHLPWNVCRTEIYSGTRLEQRLRAAGRLTGNWRTYGYQMSDPRAELMFRIMRVSFGDRAFAVDSLQNNLISIAFARQAHEAFFPGPATDHLSGQVDHLLQDVHLDSVGRLREIVDFLSAKHLPDNQQIKRFAVQQGCAMAMVDADFRARYLEPWSLINARGTTLYKNSAVA